MSTIRQLVAQALKRRRSQLPERERVSVTERLQRRDSGVLMIVAIVGVALVLFAFVLLMMG